MSQSGVGASVNDRRPSNAEEVVDLTGDDDYAPPIKKRKSAKREQIKREFEKYLLSLDPSARSQVQNCFHSVAQEKDDIMRLREHYINQPSADTNEFYSSIIRVLNFALLQLDEISVKIRTGEAPPSRVTDLAREALRKSKGARGRIEGLRQERAIRRLQDAEVREQRQKILNDPSYIQARAESMVTPLRTTTAGIYSPAVNPANSNREMLRRAFENPDSPGMLPDGSYVAPLDRDAYLDGIYHTTRQEQGRRPQFEVPYSERVNDLGYDAENYASATSSSHGADGYVATTNYGDLVDLALTEAEPLDMPPQMKCTPLDHQRQGLGWLVRAERGRNKGGILADDMGLGKTVQSIALIYANQPKTEPEVPNKHRLVLIVCPVALISTWAEELKARVYPNHWLRVYIHHRGSNVGRYLNKAKDIEESADVVICTYHGVVNEYKQMLKRQNVERTRQLNGGHRLGSSAQGDIPLFDIEWHRIILDEAHLIKNRQSQMSLAAAALHSQYRIALTGTPMQNRIEELFPLVRFLQVRPYNEYSAFQKLVPATKSSTFAEFESQKALAAFLSAVMLRRKKDTVINGKKIIDNLPPKHLQNVNTRMGDDEDKAYKEFESKIRAEVNSIAASEEISVNNMLVFLLRMRQMCCHPYLIAITRKGGSRRVWGNNKHTKTSINIAMHFPEQLRRLILETPSDERICSECDGAASSLPDTHAMSGCGHLLCVDCSIAASDALQADSDGNNVRCPLCNTSYRALVNLEILDVIENHRPRSAQIALELLLAEQRPRVEQLRSEEETRKQRLSDLRISGNDTTLFDFPGSDMDSMYGDSDEGNERVEEVGNLLFHEEAPGEAPEEHAVEGTQLPAHNGMIKVSTAAANGKEEQLFINDGFHNKGPQYPALDSLSEVPSKLPDSDVDSLYDIPVHKTTPVDTPSAAMDEMCPPLHEESDLDVVCIKDSEDNPDQTGAETAVKLENSNGSANAASQTDAVAPTKTDLDSNSAEVKDPLEYSLDIDEIAKLFRVPGIFTEGWKTSAKVEACLDVMRSIWRTSPEDKVILFTSFTSLLDVLTIPLEAAQIPYAQYTGRMNVLERNATLDDFRRGRCKILLTSLKAGNVGLTLTQANRVIIVEPFWNPYVEEQAQDRVYRIGQSREVTVYRVRIKDTVEDRIVTLQDHKRALIESALDNGMKTRAQGLSRTDILYALGLRNNPRPVDSRTRGPSAPVTQPNQETTFSYQTLS